MDQADLRELRRADPLSFRYNHTQSIDHFLMQTFGHAYMLFTHPHRTQVNELHWAIDRTAGAIDDDVHTGREQLPPQLANYCAKASRRYEEIICTVAQALLEGREREITPESRQAVLRILDDDDTTLDHLDDEKKCLTLTALIVLTLAEANARDRSSGDTLRDQYLERLENLVREGFQRPTERRIDDGFGIALEAS